MNAIIFLCAVLVILSQKVHLSEAQVNNVNRKHATQTKFPVDDIESWLNPSDGVLATENTPVYSFIEKLNIADNSSTFETIKYIDVSHKNALVYLRENKSYALTTLGNEPPNANQAKNTVIENQNPDDINSESTTTLPMIQMTTSNFSLPYPTILYPKILVIVDNALFKNVGNEVRDVILYILAYWNGVDLLFRNLESPKIKINIQAILIIECPTFFSEIQYAPNKIDGENLLLAMSSWLYNDQVTFPIDSYDMVGLMTSSELSVNGSRMAGLSYLGQACKTSHKMKRILKIATVHEIGDFLSIRDMAHEIGHLFGIDHDGYDNKRCPRQDGTIMTPDISDLGPKYSEWSQCSLDKLTQSFENKYNFSCLYNKIYEKGAAVPRILPGKFIDLDKQCNYRRGDTIAVNGEDNCQTLTCQAKPDSVGSNFNQTWPIGPLDGSYCGHGKMCLLGKCVKIS